MSRFLILLALVATSVASVGQTTPLAPVTNLTKGVVYLTIQEAVDDAANTVTEGVMSVATRRSLSSFAYGSRRRTAVWPSPV